MSITALLNRFFDRYSIVARLFPALLFTAPILLAALAVFPSFLSSIRNASLLALLTVGVLFFVSSLARSRGKIVQNRLLAEWGGWPTSIFLRHRNPVIDPQTKARYHHALKKLTGQALPTEAEEQADPTKANQSYRSATKLLIERRRGKQYPRVHEENASFGFRRNLLGLRAPAIFMALVCAVLTSAAFVMTTQPFNFATVKASVTLHPVIPALVAADFLYILTLAWGVNGRFVRQAGNEYAFALLRSLEATTATRPKVAAAAQAGS
jgi:hypothetical protein